MIRKPRRIQPIIPLASMADIVFVLIAFFWLTSSFAKDSPDGTLEKAESPDIEITETLPVSLSMDSDGQLKFQGSVTTVDGLESALTEALEGREDRQVLVTIDKSLTKRQYYPVLQALGRAGATPMLTGLKEQ